MAEPSVPRGWPPRCAVLAPRPPLRAGNIHVRDGISEDAFAAMRSARDATLGMPRLIVPSIQVNIRAGNLPEPDTSGKRFLKVPLNCL